MFWLHNLALTEDETDYVHFLRHIYELLACFFKHAWFDVVFKAGFKNSCFSLKRWQTPKYLLYIYIVFFLCSSFHPIHQQCQACLHCFHIQGPSVHCKEPSSQRLDLKTTFTSCGNVDRIVLTWAEWERDPCGLFGHFKFPTCRLWYGQD